MESAPTMARENTFNMRLSDEEAGRLATLTTHYGINAAALFRMLMKREADRLTNAGELAPPPATKKSAKKTPKK